MSEHGTPAIKPADDPAFQLPASLAALRLPLCAAGLGALLIGWAIGYYGVGEKFGMSAYLAAFIFCLTVAIGCIFFVLIQHLSRAGWSAIVRRVAELIMVMVIPLAVLFIPILFSLLGDGTLYSWDDPDYAKNIHLDQEIWNEKVRWLNPFWFTVRSIIYFAIWGGLAVYFFRGSVEQDETGERAVTDRLQWWSGPAVMLFCLTTTFAAFDWIMSLAPMWFSTMFGVYLFTGSVLSAHCAIAAGSYVLQKQGAMRDEVTVEHYHDLCKYIFGFLLFWIYIAFSQYMLIWYGNMPEETEWFFHRQEGNWWLISLGLVLFHWALPFAGTMSMAVRRRPSWIFFWSIYVLVMHFVDVYWMIMPQVREVGVTGGFLGIIATILCAGGMIALLLGLILRVAEQYKVVAVRDPRLGESLAYENIL